MGCVHIIFYDLLINLNNEYFFQPVEFYVCFTKHFIVPSHWTLITTNAKEFFKRILTKFMEFTSKFIWEEIKNGCNTTQQIHSTQQILHIFKYFLLTTVLEWINENSFLSNHLLQIRNIILESRNFSLRGCKWVVMRERDFSITWIFTDLYNTRISIKKKQNSWLKNLFYQINIILKTYKVKTRI